MTLLSIIIPVHNALEYTQECVNSIHRHTHIPYEIIIVDNGSDDGTTEWFQEEKNTKLLYQKENLGFPKAVNIGLKASTGNFLCVANNDLIFTPYWAERLIAHLDTADMVGPCTNSISGPQQVMMKDIYRNIEELDEIVEKSYLVNKGKSIPYHRLVGFCLLFKREVYEKIGGFNEIFGMGNYEDDDYCMKAIEYGFKLCIAQDVYIHHFGGTTHSLLNVQYNKLLKKNRKVFLQTWEDKYERLVKEHKEKWMEVKNG